MDSEAHEKLSHQEILKMTAQIVSAYVSHNELPGSQIPEVIKSVYVTLESQKSGDAAAAQEPPKPAVSIRKSVTPDYIVCLEDGKKLKMLKRHLKTAYNMTPEEYRERWNLAVDYPMVAPNYAKQRSKLAKQIGLGTRARRKKA